MGVEDELDLRIGLGAGDQDRLRAQLAAPVQDVHPRRVAGEEFTLLYGSVAAADHRQLLALEEGAVADRAIADAPAPELLLARHLEVARQASGGHDQSRRAKLQVPGEKEVWGREIVRAHVWTPANVKSRTAVSVLKRFIYR